MPKRKRKKERQRNGSKKRPSTEQQRDRHVSASNGGSDRTTQITLKCRKIVNVCAAKNNTKARHTKDERRQMKTITNEIMMKMTTVWRHGRNPAEQAQNNEVGATTMNNETEQIPHSHERNLLV